MDEDKAKGEEVAALKARMEAKTTAVAEAKRARSEAEESLKSLEGCLSRTGEELAEMTSEAKVSQRSTTLFSCSIS